MGIVLGNNAASTLASSITAATTSFSVASSEGALFPTLGTGDYFYATLVSTDGNIEIVKVTARSSDAMTVVRAQESTSAQAFASGSLFELRVTAQSILDAAADEITSLTLSQLGVTATADELNKLDGVTANTAELNILDGVTATTTEINILDGVTSTTAELNILDGVTATAAELNKLDGVTASTSELNILAGATVSTSELNALAGLTASAAELNILDGATLSTAELNKLDGVTVTPTEINHLSGVTSNIQTQLNAVAAFPPGVIVPYAAVSPPSGWLLCSGAAVSRVTYAGLFAIIGTTYGAGNGSTTFNIPDLRGRVVAGRDNMGGSSAGRITSSVLGMNPGVLGNTGGSETHTLTTAQLAAHTHYMVADEEGDLVSVTNARQITVRERDGGNEEYELRGTSTAATVGLTGSSGGGAAHNNLQPTMILMYIIKT